MATSLDDLISAVQNAVIKAQQLAEDHHIELVSRFFEKDEASGQMRAKTQEVWIPSLNPSASPDEYVLVRVPLISLANLGSIKIKELTVEFDAKLGSLETTDSDGDGIADVIDTDTPKGAKATPRVPQKMPPGFRRPFGPGPVVPQKRVSFDLKHGESEDAP